jgi:serine/threonine protein kinase
MGAYRIVAPLGAGGMGEVFRATDTRLGRDVALKRLPEAFATDPERLARFEREAKLLASLQHPNIATLFGLEDVGGERVLAMELVPGQDLKERLAQGPLPVDEALSVARQVAEALEEAHEHGIVHRGDAARGAATPRTLSRARRQAAAARHRGGAAGARRGGLGRSD